MKCLLGEQEMVYYRWQFTTIQAQVVAIYALICLSMGIVEYVSLKNFFEIVKSAPMAKALQKYIWDEAKIEICELNDRYHSYEKKIYDVDSKAIIESTALYFFCLQNFFEQFLILLRQTNNHKSK